MRLTVEIDELAGDEWLQVQEILQTEYQIPDGVSRACVTFVHGDEVTHREMPVGSLIGMLTTIRMTPAFRELGKAMKLVKAALAPDSADLPKDPSRLPIHSQECDDQDDDRPCLLDCPVRADT